LEAEAAFLLQADEYVDEVLVDVLGGVAVLDLFVADALALLDNFLEDGVHRLVDLLEAARHAGELGQDGGPRREQVRDVEAAGQADDGLGRRQELRRVLPLLPERGPGHDAVCDAVEHHVQVHWRRRVRRADLLHPQNHLFTYMHACMYELVLLVWAVPIGPAWARHEFESTKPGPARKRRTRASTARLACWAVLIVSARWPK
jgi:hypothetical protein